MFLSVLDKRPNARELLDPRYDVSVWARLARLVRGPYRRLFYPNGPGWFKDRISCEAAIKALLNCSDAEAEEEQRLLDESRLRMWLAGF